MAEFLRLRRNHLIVNLYEVKFTELSKYMPRMIEDLVDRARRYRDGLKPEIRSQLVPLNLKDYNELHEWAKLKERDLSKCAVAYRSQYSST